MTLFQWRKFQFFSKNDIKDESDKIKSLDITCTTSGRGKIILGDSSGNIHIVESDFSVVSYHIYNCKVDHLFQLKSRPVLFTIGEDREDAVAPLLKIWNVEKVDKTGQPVLLKTYKLNPSGKATGVPVTCMTALENLTQVAVGLINGIIVIISGGDVSRDRSCKPKFIAPERAPRDPATGQEIPDPITGMGFRYAGENPILFTVSTSEVAAIHGTAGKQRKDVLDETDDKKKNPVGCELGCMVMSDEDDLVIGREEAVFFYEPEGRGPCFAFEGPKKMLFWFRSYLCIVYNDKRPGGERAAGPPPGNELCIYDLKNKFIAYNQKFNRVNHVVSEWGSIFIFTGDGKVTQLVEKDTQTKLGLLFQKHLYAVAINLAKSQQLDPNSIADIYREHGDHLYQKRDYERAMGQYLNTIGRLEPSYVIRKFLDAQRIHNLTQYLQALHEKGLATANHTTLLLNCYTKLKDISKLNTFTQNASVQFDVEAAITVCRSAGYYDQALLLSKNYRQHDWYLKIQLEDKGTRDVRAYEEALEYIRALDFEEAKKFTIKYGKTLVENLPEQTTKLLMLLCTDYEPERAPDDMMYTPAAMMGGPRFAEPPMAGVGRGRDRDSLGESGEGKRDEDPKRNALFAMSKKAAAAVEGAVGRVMSGGPAPVPDFAPPPMTRIDKMLSREAHEIKRAAPEEFIHIFVTAPEWLTVFLETVFEATANPNAAVCNTLLELYLRPEGAGDAVRLASVPGPAGASMSGKDNLRKALSLLSNENAAYDTDQALILCKMHSFRPGILLLLEKLKLHDEILQFYMDENEYEQVIAKCKQFANPSLWIKVLSYFAGKPDASAQIADVLKTIDESNLLPPLLVVQILSSNSNATLATVKDYIQRRLQTENRLIVADQGEIQRSLEETQRMREEIHELKTTARIFKPNKCSACSSPLDLPAVHFLCMHSFHPRCMGDSEEECPVCAPDNRHYLAVARSLESRGANHEAFFKELEGSPDGFSVVAKYFSMGVFRRLTMLDDDERRRGPDVSMRSERDLLFD